MNNAQASSGKLSWTTRVAYGLGDTAQNVVWGAMSILTFFYTDYAGIDASVVGLVMLLSRCFDGVSDVIMGFLVEKTNSKWGKSRPWILWTSLPFAISIVLIYTVPQTTSALQFAYIFVTYNLCTTVCYTALNLPYGSLSAMMTRISKERDMLSIFRMALSPLGKILAVSATLPLIKVFGDNQLAWVKVMSIWAVLALLLLLICFYKCKETVVLEKTQKTEKIPARQALRFLALNKYFWIAMTIWTMQNVIACITVETIVMIAVILLVCPTLLRKYGKRNMSLVGIILALIGHLIYLINPMDFNWVVASCVIRGIFFAPLCSVIFGFFGDCIEYSQWKFHVRQEGLIFSGGSVGTKIGSGVTSAALTGLLSYAGYVSSASGLITQPQSAIDMIVSLYMYGPILVWIVLIIVLLAYNLDKIYPQIMKDLAKREAEGKL